MADGVSRRDALVAGLGILSTGCLRFSESETTTNSPSTEAGQTTPSTDSSSQTNLSQELFTQTWNQSESCNSLSIAGGRLYGSNKSITCWDTISGEQFWTVTASGGNYRRFEQVIGAGEYVYGFIGGNPMKNISPELQVFDRNSGTQRWKHQDENKDWLSSIAGNSEFVAYYQGSESGPGNFRVFRSTDGEMMTDREFDRVSDIVMKDSEIILLGNQTMIFSLDDFTLKGSMDIDAKWLTATGNSIYYTTENSLIRSNKSDFSPRWKYTNSNSTALLTKPSITSAQSEELVLIGSDYGIHAVEGETGKERWSVQTDTEISATWTEIEIVKSIAFACDNSGKLYIVDVYDGTILFEKVIKERPKVPTSFASENGRLYVSMPTKPDSIIHTGTSALDVSRG